MNEVNGKTARMVSEELLEWTRIAMMAKDFDLLLRCFHLPHTMETPEHKRVVHDRDEFFEFFKRVTEDYDRKGVTDLVRFCEVAEFRGPNRVEATHITHMMVGDHRIVAPFPSYSVLEFIDDRWQIMSSQYAVDTDTTIGRALASNIAAVPQSRASSQTSS